MTRKLQIRNKNSEKSTRFSAREHFRGPKNIHFNPYSDVTWRHRTNIFVRGCWWHIGGCNKGCLVMVGLTTSGAGITKNYKKSNFWLFLGLCDHYSDVVWRHRLYLLLSKFEWEKFWRSSSDVLDFKFWSSEVQVLKFWSSQVLKFWSSDAQVLKF